MSSLWLDRAARAAVSADTFPSSDFEAVQGGDGYDEIIVGAGLTGLTCAVLLARAGRRVAVLEARYVGAVTTGNTTAKLSLLQGTVLSEMLRHTARKNAAAYLEANREGFFWLLRYLEEHSVAHQRRDAYSYAASPAGARAVDDELQAARLLGLPVEKVTDLDLPFASYGAVRLADQAQFDPLDVLTALAADFRSRGGTIVQGVRVTGVRALTGAASRCRVMTSAGPIRAGRVVLATGVPVLDRGLYFAKLEAKRSYAMAFRVPGDRVDSLPPGMYLSVDTPNRSLRTTPLVAADAMAAGAAGSASEAGELLLVGGNGHTTGREPQPSRLVADLEQWTTAAFPGAERLSVWSAQDYTAHNRIPFVGWLPRSAGRVFLATGYNKWGMTNGVAAALRLTAELLGGDLPWAKTLGRRITRLPSFGAGIKANAEVAAAAARGWGAALGSSAADGIGELLPPEGAGEVSRVGLRPVGRCTVGGATYTVSAVCPHLGGVLAWNDQERSWDCPLHGSRFSASGERLEGPATADLTSA